MRSKDPETGYIGQGSVGIDYGEHIRCKRCGGRGMVSIPVNQPLNPEKVICLRCSDDWDNMASTLFDKHGWRDARSNRKKWDAAYDEFLQTKPTEVDVAAHNQRIESTNRQFFGMFPHLKKLVEESKSKQ